MLQWLFTIILTSLSKWRLDAYDPLIFYFKLYGRCLTDDINVFNQFLQHKIKRRKKSERNSGIFWPIGDFIFEIFKRNKPNFKYNTFCTYILFAEGEDIFRKISLKLRLLLGNTYKGPV